MYKFTIYGYKENGEKIAIIENEYSERKKYKADVMKLIEFRNSVTDSFDFVAFEYVISKDGVVINRVYKHNFLD